MRKYSCFCNLEFIIILLQELDEKRIAFWYIILVVNCVLKLLNNEEEYFLSFGTAVSSGGSLSVGNFLEWYPLNEHVKTK